jgi:ATP-binding protein involved in chromosome partitioning
MFRRQKLSEAQVYEILKTVKYPGYTRDIVSFGLVKSVHIHEQNVEVVVQMTTNQQEVATQLQQAAAEALRGLSGIGTVQVDVRLKDQGAAPEHTHHPASSNVAPLPGVHNILAVASGKGGVGKSTVATNLAVALSMAGLRTGLLMLIFMGQVFR